MSILRGNLYNLPHGFCVSLIGFIALALAGCGGSGGGATSTTTSTSKVTTTATVTLASIAITPPSVSLSSGSTANLTATGSYTDGTTANLTDQVTWTSGNSTIATVSTTGAVTAVSPGNTTIVASLSGISSSAVSINITNATLTGISISPGTTSAPVDQAVTLVAMGTFADLTIGNVSGSASWTSSSPSVATVSSNGVVTTLAAGTTTITASLNGFTSNATLTVTNPVAADGPLAGATWTYTSQWSQVADATVPNGGSVFQAPPISDSQSTTASVTVNVPAAGNVSFYYKVSSETDYDYLIFTIDGVEPSAARWSGLVPWALASYPITAGTHTLSWKYLKDVSLGANLDTAWISQVSIPAPPVTVVGTQMGGARQGVPLALTTAVTTAAGTGTGGFVNNTGTLASFYLPQGITTDGINLYVADTFNNAIRKVVIATGAVTTLAGSGVAGATDGTGTMASFSYPWGITTDGTNLYVADTGNHKIRRIVIATGVVTTVAGTGAAGFVNGAGTLASFNGPLHITTDGTNLYVADTSNHSIRQIAIASGVVTTVAGTGSAGFVNNTGTLASFNYPKGITTDGTNLYVADQSNHSIRKIVIATGIVSTVAGSNSWGFVDSTGTTAKFFYPIGITTDGTSLYVADSANYAIRKVVIATGVVTTVAGTGVSGFVDGTGTSASFSGPKGITTDGVNLYVADPGDNGVTGKHAIRRIQ